MAGAAWVGQDGDTYTRVAGQNGVRNLGSAQGTGILMVPHGGTWNGLSVIADPVSHGYNGLTSNQTAAIQPNAGVSAPALSGGAVSLSGGGVAAPVGPSDAQVNPLMSSLDSLDEILNNKNSQSHAEYNRAIKGYDSQDALDSQAHDKNVTQNEQSLTANDQAALLNAANGATGLRGVLASLGALAGSGRNIIERLVGSAANQDAGAAHQTFDVNATNLGQAWSNAERQQRQRREDASATLDNNLQNNKASVLNSRQSIYEQLANLYGDQLPQGKEYASKASALSAPIAATTKADVAPYAKPSASFSPQALKDYLAGTQNLDVSTSAPDPTDQTPINSPIYQAARKKDQLPGVA